MKKIQVGVVDYGMGNLHSVAKALSLQGPRVVVSSSVATLKKSHLLVLPGVGAFGAAMTSLAKHRLDSLIQNWIENDRPYLGICLGFQLLFENSEENKGVKGLGVFKGPVVSFKKRDFKNNSFQIPHMGWNTASCSNSDAKKYLKGLSPEDYFYFVHTYFPKPSNRSLVATTTPYGVNFCSSVAKGKLFASQFHPEKSGTVGLKLLKNIVTEASLS